MATVQNTKVTPATWNGLYPLKDLQVGDYWYGTYANATQCVGFARMVLDATYGAGDSIGATPFTNADSVRNAFIGMPIGSRVTFNRVDSTEKHAVIVTARSTTGITVYDCNFYGPDRIGYRVWTWADVLQRYTGISSGVKRA